MRNNLRWMRVLGTQRVSNQSEASRGQEMCRCSRCWCSAHSGLSRGCRAKDSQRAAGSNKPCSSLRPSRRRRCSDDIRPTRGRAPRLVARRLAGPPQFTASMVASRIFYPKWPLDPRRLNLGLGPCGPRPVRYQISIRLICFLWQANAAELVYGWCGGHWPFSEGGLDLLLKPRANSFGHRCIGKQMLCHNQLKSIV